MRCFRILLGISYRDYVTNEEVRNTIRYAIGPYEYLITTVRKRKMVWAHNKINRICKDDPTGQDKVPGGRRKGRQKKRWEDVRMDRIRVG